MNVIFYLICVCFLTQDTKFVTQYVNEQKLSGMIFNVCHPILNVVLVCGFNDLSKSSKFCESK